MSLKIVTYMETLFQLAKDLAAAERTGDPELIRIAKAKHEAYKEMCLRSDEIIVKGF